MAATEATARFIDGASLVHVFRLYLAPYLDGVLSGAERPPIIVDIDEREKSSLVLRPGDQAEGDAFSRLERHYLPQVDNVLTAAPGDATALRAEYGLASVVAIPNAVRPPDEEWLTARPEPRFDLLFVGNLSYGPNVEAARWLATEVVPHLGAVRVAIVGSHPGPEVVSLAAADSRITVAPDVATVSPWYAQSQVVVVPVFGGGGTRIKVIEAFAHRRPVVSTRLGAAGLPFARFPPSAPSAPIAPILPIAPIAFDEASVTLGDGIVRTGPVLVADQPGPFAAACRRLLDDGAFSACLAEQGERDVLRTSTVAVVAPQIAQLARRILSP
jgi:glycosyltransferase involved in cell wall biosynthesis